MHVKFKARALPCAATDRCSALYVLSIPIKACCKKRTQRAVSTWPNGLPGSCCRVSAKFKASYCACVSGLKSKSETGKVARPPLRNLVDLEGHTRLTSRGATLCTLMITSQQEMRLFIWMLVACIRGLTIPARKLHLTGKRRHITQRRCKLIMLRNRDRPELLVFVGQDIVIDAQGVAQPGVARLVAEARDAETPSIWLVSDDASTARPAGLVAVQRPEATEPLPCPSVLQTLRQAITITPDAFGGADGFGRGQAQAARSPLPARCIVLSADRDGCIAGRAAGMRVVGVGDGLDDAADVVFYDLDGEEGGFACHFDDLYTPGSYWINPPVPRTVDGHHCDPVTGARIMYTAFGARIDVTEGLHEGAALNADDGASLGLTEAERAVLADLDPIAPTND